MSRMQFFFLLEIYFFCLHFAYPEKLLLLFFFFFVYLRINAILVMWLNELMKTWTLLGILLFVFLALVRLWRMRPVVVPLVAELPTKNVQSIQWRCRLDFFDLDQKLNFFLCAYSIGLYVVLIDDFFFIHTVRTFLLNRTWCDISYRLGISKTPLSIFFLISSVVYQDVLDMF